MERVTRALVAAAGFDDGLYARVQGRLDELRRDSESELDQAEAALEGKGEVWEHLAQARKSSTLLFRESFAFVEGALWRQAQLDGGLCALADKLLDSLDSDHELNWRGLTVMGEGSFYGDAAEVIRLRYPELTIWHLPVAVHEFGHFANPQIRVKARAGSVWGWRYPVQAMLDRAAKRDPTEWFRTHELLADIFAVFAIGPAYAYASLLLRPDPRLTGAESRTHPSWSERYFVIVETLRRITRHGGATAAIVRDVAARSEEIRALASRPAAPDTKALKSLVSRFYPLLDGGLRGVRYETFVEAQKVEAALADDAEGLGAAPGVRMADILNAAWLARIGELENDERTATIEARARQACEAL